MKSITELVFDISQTISLPLNNEDRWSQQAVVDAMNRAFDEKVVSELIKLGGEFLVVREVVPLRDSSNNLLYPGGLIPIPKRAYARILREVKFLAPNKTERFEEINLPQTSVTEYDTLRQTYTTAGASPIAFYIENDTLGLFSEDSAIQGSLVFYYYLRPNTLTNKTTEFAEITNVSYSSPTLTLTTNAAGAELVGASGYAQVGQTKLFDVFRKSTGALFEHSVPFTVVSSTSFTSTSLKFNAESPTEFEAWQQGGFPLLSYETTDLLLVPAGQCQFATIPEEWDTLLVYHTCSKILESLGDIDGLAANEKRIVDLHERLKNAYGSRVMGERKKAIDRRNIAAFQRFNFFNRWR